MANDPPDDPGRKKALRELSELGQEIENEVDARAAALAQTVQSILGPGGPLEAGFARLRYELAQPTQNVPVIAALKGWLAVAYTYIEMGMGPGNELDVAALIMLTNEKTGRMSGADTMQAVSAKIAEYRARLGEASTAKA